MSVFAGVTGVAATTAAAVASTSDETYVMKKGHKVSVVVKFKDDGTFQAITSRGVALFITLKMGRYEHNAEDGYMPKDNLEFSDITIRQRFIRKVFMTVTLMLAVVAAMSAIPYIVDGSFEVTPGGMKDWIKRSPTGMMLYFLSYIVFLVVYILLMCFEKLRRSHPVNLYLTGILTLSIGFMTMMICARHKIEFVMIALVITTICCGSVILFASQTRIDFTSCIGYLCVTGFALFFFGIFAILALMVWNFKWMYIIYCFLMVVFLMGYLAIDVQLLMGGKKFEVSPEEHIFISIQLFLDIVLAFWYILSLFFDSN
uniref:Uncharacterized protein n=1 Tax=Acrobeloides nanus TaxID=290746 RepID=A0A914DKB1_9BILA